MALRRIYIVADIDADFGPDEADFLDQAARWVESRLGTARDVRLADFGVYRALEHLLESREAGDGIFEAPAGEG